LYHRRLARQFVKVVDTNDSRMTAIKVATKDGHILIVGLNV